MLPGMQAAFVDIGLEKAAFLHASDFSSNRYNREDNGSAKDDGTRRQHLDIRQLAREGQEVVVQVVKDPLGTKGARLTTDITLPSRYLVYMPDVEHVGVSQRIEDENERPV